MDENLEKWAKEQFANINLGDKRLNMRAQLIGINMIKKPAESINMQSENWSQSKGAYRFFDNEKVSFPEIIKPHINLIKDQIKSCKTILAIQDTCMVGYDHHKSVTDLGHIGKKESSGVILHNTIAVDPSFRVPQVIGLLDQATHNRRDDKKEGWTETNLWIEASNRININVDKTQVVEIMDREGDVYDIMKNCLSQKHDFLIRAKGNKIVRNPFKHKLTKVASKTKVAGKIKIEIPKRKGQKKRAATLEIKFLPINIPGPVGKREEIIECNLVQAVEINPLKNQEPLNWFLLTSINVSSFQDALKIIEWYKYRWIVEEYHKCIKTGCNVQKKQLKTAFRIENYLAIAGVIAIKLLQIRDLARVLPDKKASGVIDPMELKMIQAYHKIDKDLTVKGYYFLLAKMGGFLGRKSDGDPGWQTLWKGQLQLYWMVQGAKMLLKEIRTYG